MFVKPVCLGVIGCSQPVVDPHASHELCIHLIVELTSLIGSDDMGNTHDKEQLQVVRKVDVLL